MILPKNREAGLPVSTWPFPSGQNLKRGSTFPFNTDKSKYSRNLKSFLLCYMGRWVSYSRYGQLPAWVTHKADTIWMLTEPLRADMSADNIRSLMLSAELLKLREGDGLPLSQPKNS